MSAPNAAAEGEIIERADQHAEPRSLEIALLVLLAVLWGIPFALTKLTLQTIPPFTAVTARVALAAATLWVIVLASGSRIPTDATFIRRLSIQALVGCLIPYMLVTLGQQSVASGLAAVLNSTSPLFVCVITLAWTRHESMSFLRILGVTVGLGGAVTMAGAGALNGLAREVLGQSLILAATVSLAVGAIHARRFDHVAPEVTAAGMLTSSAVMLVPLCLLIEGPLRSTPSAGSLTALLVQAVVSTAFGFALYFRLTRTIGSMGTATVGYLKPGVGVFLGCAVMGEPFTWTLGLGLIAVVLGVAAITWRGQKPQSRTHVIRSLAAPYALLRHVLRRPVSFPNAANG